MSTIGSDQDFECYKCKDTYHIKLFSHWDKGDIEEEPNAVCKDCDNEELKSQLFASIEHTLEANKVVLTPEKIKGVLEILATYQRVAYGEKETKCESDKCDMVGLCNEEKCHWESDEEEKE
tara:strand:- start:224 stop:586 length:363 start_codon:yes stop_codon:yes gene_type:complete